MGIQMRCAYFALAVIFLLVSCSSPTPTVDLQNAIGTAVAQTQMASPSATPTPTPVPLAELNLEDLFLEIGDLPAEYEMGQISYELPQSDYKSKFPEAAQVVWYRIGTAAEQTNRKLAEGTILLYDNLEDVDKAYDIFLNSLGSFDADLEPVELENLGEKAIMASQYLTFFGMNFNHVLFTHCHATIYLVSTTSTEPYARRLDKRLEPFVCR